MKIPADKLIIPKAKITDYLLVWHEEDDKSKFLAQAGFTLENADELESAIRKLASVGEAEADKMNKFGTYYQIKGELVGPTKRVLAVITIWLNEFGETYRFVTLKPWRKSSDET